MVFESSFPDAVIPDESFYSFVFKDLQERSGLVALIDTETNKSITFQELKSACDSFAIWLQGLRLNKGDVFLVALPNGIPFVVAYLAGMAQGLVVAVINCDASEAELDERIRDCNPKICACTSSNLTSLEHSKTWQNLHCVCTGLTTLKRSNTHCVKFDDIVALKGEFRPPKIYPKTDLAVLQYFSDTEGQPKAAMLTHYNLVAAHCVYADKGFQAHPSLPDRVLISQPLQSVNAQSALRYCLKTGATTVLMSTFTRLAFVEVVQKYRINYVPLVRSQIEWLSGDPSLQREKLKSLQICVISSGSCSKPLIAKFRKTYPHIQIVGQTMFSAYGLPETTAITHATLPTKEFTEHAADPIGVLLGNMSCKIINLKTKRECDIGEAGELWIKSPTNMAGYWRKPEQTKATFDDDGYLRTGDLVKFDQEENFYRVGRVKDFTVYSMSANEIENVLMSHPDVADASVVRVDDCCHHAIVAAVKSKRNVATEEELMRIVAEKLPQPKRLNSVKFVDSIPRSNHGTVRSGAGVELLRNQSKL